MFEIILNNPNIDKKKSLKVYESVGEIIENIFPLSDDWFILKWNNINVYLSYKYDLSIIFEDFLYIYEFLESPENICQMTFPSNTFDVIWNIEKSDKNIIVASQWNTVLSHNEKILNESSSLKISVFLFKNELSKLLKFIYDIIICREDDINKQLFSDLLKNKPTSLIIEC